MPLFFFDISNGRPDRDAEGFECATLDQARTQAIRFTGELLKFHSDWIWEGHDLRVQVSNDTGTPLFDVVTRARNLFPAS